PILLILDEPSLGLSPLLVEELFALIQRINREGTTLLLVEQNVVQSLEVAHRAYILENGSVVLDGPSDHLRNDLNLKRTYFGLCPWLTWKAFASGWRVSPSWSRRGSMTRSPPISPSRPAFQPSTSREPPLPIPGSGAPTSVWSP